MPVYQSASALFFLSFFLLKWYTHQEPDKTKASEETLNFSFQGGHINMAEIFSPSSLIREVREMTGYGNKKPISGDGQNMIISQVLHHYRDELKYYSDSAAQPTLAAKIAGQIDDFTRARLTSG